MIFLNCKSDKLLKNKSFYSGGLGLNLW